MNIATFVLPFHYSEIPTRNAKRLRFFQTLICGPEYVGFVGIKIQKTVQRLAGTTRFFWEINFPKISRNFDK